MYFITITSIYLPYESLYCSASSGRKCIVNTVVRKHSIDRSFISSPLPRFGLRETNVLMLCRSVHVLASIMRCSLPTSPSPKYKVQLSFSALFFLNVARCHLFAEYSFVPSLAGLLHAKQLISSYMSSFTFPLSWPVATCVFLSVWELPLMHHTSKLVERPCDFSSAHPCSRPSDRYVSLFSGYIHKDESKSESLRSPRASELH